MKRTLLTILPIAAALLLATSCSKDSDTDNNVVSTPVETQNVASSAESKAIPFSIKVVTDNSLSKIGYTDNGMTVTPSFTSDDVVAALSMTISEGATELGKLTLQDSDGNFSGNLTTEPSAEGATLTATITTTGDATSSTVSIIDLMAKCAHTYTGTFTYKTDDKVMLTDDKAYIEIIMSPLQHNIDVTIGSDKQPFTMSDEGKVWIAVDGGTTFTMNFTNEKTATAGKITTIKREGLVDLGLSDGTLWADKNVGATTYGDAGEYYNFNAAQTAVSSPLSVPKGGEASAADNDFAILNNSCTWKWTDGYGGGSSAGYIVYKKGGSDISKDAHIFLPAAGYRYGGGVGGLGGRGYYWSSTEDDADRGFSLRFRSGLVGPDSYDDRGFEFSVRAVRRK